MSRNILTFDNENLVVDWVGFNSKGSVNQKQVERIAKYLFQNFGFNSTFALGLNGKQETLFYNPRNEYQVYFRVYKYSDIYWNGIKIDFPGLNGHQFYSLITINRVNWKIFNCGKSLELSRLDLCYTRKKINISESIKSFLEQCYQKVAENKVIKNFSLQKNSTGWILKIGKRGSPNYYRVYENEKEIRFELEQKRLKIKPVKKLITENQIQDFEQRMTEIFFKHSKKVLAIDENYTNWLIDYFRRQNQTKELLVTGYFSTVKLNLNSINQKKIFFKFLQFLAFSRSQTATTEIFGEQPYSIIQFKATDFMNFIQINNKNQYQRKQLIQFFEKIQTMGPFVKIFTNHSFQSFTIFPFVKTRKEFGEYGPWVIEVAILQELYLYSYRFFFPTYFITYQLDFELQIKLQFIQSYSTKNLKKSFYLDPILDQYKKVNNQKKSQIKKRIQYTFDQALQHQMIQSNCQVKFKNKKRKTRYIQVQNLTSLLIGQSETIYFYENIF